MIEYVWRVTLPKGEPGALGIGILTHGGLEVITNGGTLEEAHLTIVKMVEDALERLPEEVVPFVGPTWYEAGYDAQNYVTGYVEWLESTGADQRYVTCSAEEELQMPLLTIENEDEVVHYVLRGKLDRRMYDRVTERNVFMDYKTTARFEDLENARYRNEQFPTYELLLRHNYPDERCGAGVWRMLRKVKRARDGDGDFYRDTTASFNDHVLESIFARYRVMAGEMHVVEEAVMDGWLDAAYPSPDFRCEWDCPYKHECPMFDDGSRIQDAIREQYVEFDPYERYEQKGSDQ